MVIVDVGLPRFLLVRPTWCHSAAKSRWRAQARSQRSQPETTRLFTATGYKRSWPKGYLQFGVKFLRGEGPARAGDRARGRGANLRNEEPAYAIDEMNADVASECAPSCSYTQPKPPQPCYLASKSAAFSMAGSRG